ncbi:hypothetical protein B9Z55_021249 [Caenorhabditis nigoni]|uniref:SPK domain-containing protein n=1 Tax=Caenorhabditis nigoni TaxID=1611254 RepID=A0A2G5TRQ8_9PELO|nr:hypothetical protein B9Z55_021249 [Caenorhabditis nigoni]
MSTAKNTASIDVSEFIRHISDRIGNYDKPESLSQWCEKILNEFWADKLIDANCMRSRVWKKLNKVETLEGFTLMEKLQLVFIFSKPVSNGFVHLLKEAKFQIEQDGENRISQFSSEDGSVVRFSDHNSYVKYFQGTLCLRNRFQKNVNKKRMTQEEEQIQQEADNENPDSDVQQIEEEPVENAPIEPKQEEMDAEVKEEPNQEEDDALNIGGDVRQPAFNGRINYDELDEQEFVYPGFPQNIKPETAMRPQKRHQSSNTVSVKRIKTEEMESSATTSDSTATSSIKKIVKVEKDKKTPTRSSNSSVQSTKPELETSVIPKVEKSIGISSTSRKATAEATPKVTLSTSDSAAMSSNQQFVNVEKLGTNLANIETSVETSSPSSSSSSPPGSSSLVETKSDASAQPLSPEATSTKTPPVEADISVIALATQIETIASYNELKNLEKKASRAIEMMNEMGDKKLSVKKFNLLFGSMMVCVEENRISNAESSITLKTLLKQLQLFLIKPLGTKIVDEAMQMMAEKIEEFKNNNDGVPATLLSDCLTNLLIATGFYNQLE